MAAADDVVFIELQGIEEASHYSPSHNRIDDIIGNTIDEFCTKMFSEHCSEYRRLRPHEMVMRAIVSMLHHWNLDGAFEGKPKR